eukprot:COSAG02_NODE_330_length_24501_cov_39.465850_13_plen_43_part_00
MVTNFVKTNLYSTSLTEYLIRSTKAVLFPLVMAYVRVGRHLC